MFSNWGVRKKLLVITLATMLPLLAGAMWITIALMEKAYSRQADFLERATLDRVSSRLSFLTGTAAKDAVFLSRLPFLEALAQDATHRGSKGQDGVRFQDEYNLALATMLGFINSKQVYDQARLLDRKGQEILRINLVDGKAREVPQSELQPKGSRYYFIEAAKLPDGRVYVSYVDLNREKGQIERPFKPMLRFAAPLRDDAGRLIGVVVLNFYAQHLFRRSLDGIQDRTAGVWAILDQDGFYLYHSSDPKRMWGSPRDLNTGEGCRKDFGADCQSIMRGKQAAVEMDGQPWHSYSRVVTYPQNLGRSLVVAHLVPPPDMAAYLGQFGWVLTMILVVALAAVLLLAWTSGRTLVRPLIDLSGTMQRFSQNDWSARSDLRGSDELGRLATGFNRMAERLQELYSDLAAQVAALEEANQELGFSEARIRAILDNTVDAIITIDIQGVVQSFNKGAEKIFGYTSQEVVGNKVNMLQPPDVAENHDQYLKHYLETGEAHIIGKAREERGRRKDGSLFPMSLAVSDVRVGETRLFTGIIRDITALREAEDSLRASQAMYQSLAEAAPVGIFYTDPQGKCTYFNEQYLAMSGLPGEEALGDGWTRAIHPEDRDAIFEQWTHTAETGVSFEGEYRFQHADGKVVWFNARAVPHRDAQGKVKGYVGTVMDITDRKEMERSLIESTRLFQSTFDQAAVGIAHVAPDGAWLRVNDKLCQIVGYTREELMGEGFQDITHPDDLEADLRLLERVLGGEISTYTLEKRYIKKDGSIIWINLTVALVRDDEGEPSYFISVVEDIDGRKRAEKAKAESEKRFRALVSNVPGAVYRCENDEHWTMRFVSDAIQGITGHPAEDFIENRRRAYVEVIHPEDRDRVAQEVEKALGQGESFELEYRIVRSDGQTRWVYEKGQAIQDEEGNQWLDGAIMDITQRKLAEEDSARLGRVMEESLNEIIIFDAKDLTILQANRGARRNLGYSMDELSHMTALDIKPEFTLEQFEKLTAPLREGTQEHIEFTTLHERKDGSTYPVEVYMQRSSQQVRQVLVSIILDVTDKQKDRAEIDRLSLVAQRTDNAVMITDGEGRIQWVNEAFTRISEYTLEDALGKKPREILHGPETDPETVAYMRQRMTKGEGVNVELVNYSKSGRKYWLTLDVQPVRDDDGNVSNFVAVESDITKRKEAEEAVRQAKETAEEANRVKSEFLANMSHELRTPLNAIIGFSEILLDQTFGELNEKQSRQTQHILDSGRHLLSLINDILDLSKVESGKMELETSRVNLASLLESTMVLIKEKTSKHGITLALELPDRLRDLNFSADERKFKQIMFNLLSNAAKFTPDGGAITISAQREGDTLQVRVTDTGLGIGQNDQARIFEEFEQVDSTYARKQQGTGLGLALTRKLVELHGGRIWVESAGLNQGSTFIFSIPLRAAERVQEPESGETAVAQEQTDLGERGSVLVVDDDPMARELLTGYLRDGGYDVIMAGDGAQGLELAKRFKPKAITLDIMLPDTSGFEVLRQLQEDPETALIPVIIVSITDDREKGLSLGATDFLQKPVKKTDLLHVLSEMVTCSPGAFSKVLVIDDNPADVELVHSVLGSRGCQVKEANGGEQGIEIALREKPDLIILDLNMPNVSGWDVLEALQKKGGAWRPPILVFTGTALSVQERKRLAGRVQAVVMKGGGKEDLLREMDRLTQMTVEGS